MLKYGYELMIGYEDGYFRRGQNFFERNEHTSSKSGFASMSEALVAMAGAMREVEERDERSAHDHWAEPLRVFCYNDKEVALEYAFTAVRPPRVAHPGAEKTD